MKKSIWFVLGILVCLAVATGAYFWATGTINSLYTYRSPLHANPPAAGEPVGQPLTRRVVLVLIDALRYDTSTKTDVMPFFDQLRQQGASATMHSEAPSYSEPGYSVLMTGAWPDISDGPAMNNEYVDIPTWTQDNLFSAAHRQGLNTGISGYNWFEKLVPQDAVTDSFYTEGEDQTADRNVIDAALPWLKDGNDQLVLIHIDQVDYAGHHEGGPISPNWDAAATRADNLLKQIVYYMDLSKDTLVVFSDHGQIDRGGHGGQDPITLVEPFIMVGAGVNPGTYPDMKMVDLAPTVATLLGLNIPATNEGHPLTAMLTLPSGEETVIQSALMAQQEQLLKTYTKAIGSNATVTPGGDIVDATQAAMDRARAARVNGERIWRGLLALIILLAPAVILIIRREKKALWLLGAAVLYILLFNLRYAVLDGNTYSLSSVAGQTELIIYVAITAAAALAITWLVTMLATKSFQKGAFHAAKSALSLALMTIYVLALPILISVALNGMVITWTLPDMLTMFLAFISIIQWLMVAVVGLVLSGISAGIGALARKRT